MQFPEITKIRTLFNNYKNLGASDLQSQNNEISFKIGKKINSIKISI